MDLIEQLKELTQTYRERRDYWTELGNDDRRNTYGRVIGDLCTLIEEVENQ